MNATSEWLMVIAAFGFLAATVLFFRMLSGVNKMLPPEKRIPLLEYRYRTTEIKRLYEDVYPESTVPTVWLLLGILSASLIAVGVVLEIAK
jgi:hypothetical protein